MSKVIKVYNSNYKVSVQSGGTITLDTGPTTGNTVITGNLEVQGTTTTVDSTVTTIADNIITLSKGTTGNGIPASVGYISGIEVDRGTLQDAKWVFDEQISWSVGGATQVGAFESSLADGTRLPISTPGIVAQGNLYVNTGAGVITVTGTTDYEEKVWNYTNSVVTPDANGIVVIDDDVVPNAKAVKDYIEFVFANEFYNTIGEGDSNVTVTDEIHTLGTIVNIDSSGNTTVISTTGQHGFTTADTVSISGVSSGGDALENLNGTGIQILDIVSARAFKVNVNTTGGNIANYVADSGTITKTGSVPSNVAVNVEGNLVANFYQDRIEIADVRIEGSTISSTTSNQDLELSAPGTGAVRINDVLELATGPYINDPSATPIAPSSGIRLYSNPQGIGKTGLYYVNSNNTNDEIISKNRSLLFSMLF
tara:strand:+ start:53 stop:1324 length:1272 start_codon:yes stop_codon:yes gene_type:complete